MTVNEFAKEVHENAVAHGWWETARSFPEVAALIHSEVSEALRGVARRQSGYLWVLWHPGRGVRVRGCLRQGRENRHLQAGGSRRRALRRDYPHPRLPRYMGVDVEAVLMAKHEYNKGREYRHGGKRA